jgi:hypothetical protein
MQVDYTERSNLGVWILPSRFFSLDRSGGFVLLGNVMSAEVGRFQRSMSQLLLPTLRFRIIE